MHLVDVEECRRDKCEAINAPFCCKLQSKIEQNHTQGYYETKILKVKHKICTDGSLNRTKFKKYI